MLNKSRNAIRKSIFAATLAMSMVTTMAISSPISNQAIVQASTQNSIKNLIPKLSIASRTSTTATLKIAKNKEVSYYMIYRATKKDGPYTYVGKTTNSTYKDSNLKAYDTYYYKIKAYNASSKSKYSKAIKLNATVKKVKNITASYSEDRVNLSWSKVDGASKYKIYRATQLDGDYQYIGSSSNRKYKDSTVSEGKTYYYRVRGMKESAGTKYNGVYSKKVKVNCKSEHNSSYVNEVLRLVNKEREKEGLTKLTTTEKLNKAAHKRAIETKTLFSHDRPDGTSCFTVLKEFDISYNTAGENIAYGQRTPKEVVDGWMNSPGHRANILNANYGKIGIGCYQSNGVYYWTQLFTN